ncbi:hypothetical protein GCM10009608_16440 [Pseudonocardia alaniniphila]
MSSLLTRGSRDADDSAAAASPSASNEATGSRQTPVTRTLTTAMKATGQKSSPESTPVPRSVFAFLHSINARQPDGEPEKRYDGEVRDEHEYHEKGAG